MDLSIWLIFRHFSRRPSRDFLGDLNFKYIHKNPLKKSGQLINIFLGPHNFLSIKYGIVAQLCFCNEIPVISSRLANQPALNFVERLKQISMFNFS